MRAHRPFGPAPRLELRLTGPSGQRRKNPASDIPLLTISNALLIRDDGAVVSFGASSYAATASVSLVDDDDPPVLTLSTLSLTGVSVSPALTVTSADGANVRTYTVSLHRKVEWVKVQAGWDHVCGLRSNGQAIPVPSDTFSFISASRKGVCGIKTDESLLCWQYNGTNKHGGDSGVEVIYSDFSVTMNDTTRNYRHTNAGYRLCGVTTDGDVLCKCAPLSRTGSYTMVTIAYGSRICALTSTGSVECWDGDGFSSYGVKWVPPSVDDDADIREMSIGGVPVPVDRTDTAYSISVAADRATADVEVFPYAASAGVAITPDDSDAVAAGHQVSLSVGSNSITVTITSEDGNTTKAYTITVTRPA